MNGQSKAKSIASTVAALLLWLLTVGLGLEGINVIKNIFSLIAVSLGGGGRAIEAISLWLVVLLAIFLVVLVIGTAEYHWKRIGRRESWRLFGWTIAGEVSIFILYYLLYYLL